MRNSTAERSRRSPASSSTSTAAASSSSSPSAGASSSSSSFPIAGTPSSSSSPTTPTPTVEMKEDIHLMPRYILHNGRGASATVSFQGAQVLSWKTEHGEELLFTSKKAVFDYPHPVRGGITICFPQFRNQGTQEQYGFAREKIWLYEKDPPPLLGDFSGKAFVDLLLKPQEEDRKVWPHSFEFRIRICLAANGNLTLISRVRNVDSSNFSFFIGFHTYFCVSDIGDVRVEGLDTLNYLDKLLQNQCFTEQGCSLSFESEVDRVYIETNNMVAVLDHQKRRTFVIRKDGLPDIVVWNPWEKKSKAIKDIGNEEYMHMLCVDSASVENPITLKPGQEWTGRLELSLLLSS